MNSEHYTHRSSKEVHSLSLSGTRSLSLSNQFRVYITADINLHTPCTETEVKAKNHRHYNQL